MDPQVLYVLIIAGGLIGMWMILYLIPVGLWFTALLSGVQISLIHLIFMKWRGVPPSTIVNALINAEKAGLVITRQQLMQHYQEGGQLYELISALIAAKHGAEYDTEYEVIPVRENKPEGIFRMEVERIDGKKVYVNNN